MRNVGAMIEYRSAQIQKLRIRCSMSRHSQISDGMKQSGAELAGNNMQKNYHLPVGSMGLSDESYMPRTSGMTCSKCSPKSERDLESGSGLYTLYGSNTALPSETTDASPRMSVPVVHNDYSQNHQYYSQAADFHGLRRLVLDDNQRRAHHVREKEIRKRKEAEAMRSPVRPHSRRTISVEGSSPRLPAILSALSRSEATNAPPEMDAALESEYVTLSQSLPPKTCLFSSQIKPNDLEAPEGLEMALASTLDRQLNSVQQRSRQLSERERDCLLSESPSTSPSTYSGILLGSAGDVPTGPPTAFEVRRMHQQAMPPIRSVKSVAERKRTSQSVLISTRRIVPFCPKLSCLDAKDVEATLRPRMVEQKQRTNTLSQVEKWQVRMGLLDVTEACPAAYSAR